MFGYQSREFAKQKIIEMKKVHADPKSALAGILKDGMMIISGGFGLAGIPEALIARLARFRRQGI